MEESNIDPKQSSVKKSFTSHLYLADFLLEAKILEERKDLALCFKFVGYLVNKVRGYPIDF